MKAATVALVLAISILAASGIGKYVWHQYAADKCIAAFKDYNKANRLDDVIGRDDAFNEIGKWC